MKIPDCSVVLESFNQAEGESSKDEPKQISAEQSLAGAVHGKRSFVGGQGRIPS